MISELPEDGFTLVIGKRENRWHNILRCQSMQPHVKPEASLHSIPDGDSSGSPEKGHVLIIAQELRALPWPLRAGPLVPWPSNA